jgi:hypothetical protein
VLTSSHLAHDRAEPVELTAFRRSQRMFLEERDDPAFQIVEPPDLEPVQVVSVIIVSAVEADLAASEEPLQLVQHVHAPRPCTTENAGWTCQPSVVVTLRKIGTLKHPSPSTKPTIHCSIPSLSC